MIKILQFLWHGCWHNWELSSTGAKSIDGRPNGLYYIFKCSNCARIEERNKGWQHEPKTVI